MRNVVCIIVEDGDIYRFAHRSFQTYFAACYTSNILTDEQQQKLFLSQFSSSELFWDKEDYYEFLSQIEPQRFAVNALENGLRTFMDSVNAESDPDVFFVKSQFNAVSTSTVGENRNRVAFHIGAVGGGHLYYNLINVFRHYVLRLTYEKKQSPDENAIKSLMGKVCANNEKQLRRGISLESIDSSNAITDEERRSFYNSIICVYRITEIRVAISKWLEEIARKRKILTTIDFIDDL